MKVLICILTLIAALACQSSYAEEFKCEKKWKRLGDMDHTLTVRVTDAKPVSISYTGSVKLQEDGLAYNCFFDASPKDKMIAWKDLGRRVQIVDLSEDGKPGRLSLDYSASSFTLTFEEFNRDYYCGQAAEPPKSITLIKGKTVCEVVK
jgi:hypothetical protein